MAKKLPTHKTSVDICNEALEVIGLYVENAKSPPPRKHVDSREVTVRALPEKVED